MLHALSLAGDGAAVHFLAICDARGVGATDTAAVGEHRAEAALALAREAAREAGVQATTELVHDTHPGRRLLATAADHDLLVVGGHGHSRTAEIALGRTAGLAAHAAPGPVLIARPGALFDGPVLAATDARAASRPVIELAARIARAHARPLTLVHADHLAPEERHALALHAAMAQEVTGVEPVVECEPGHPVERILVVAERDRPGLIVVGSEGKTGVRALGSVSERVAMRAHSSVLIVRPGTARQT